MENVEILELPCELPEKFNAYIEENLFSVRLIAHKMNIDCVYLSQMLRKKKPLTQNVRIKLNQLLNTNF